MEGAEPPPLQQLYQSLQCPNSSWSDQSVEEYPLQSIRLCKVSSQPSTSSQPLAVTQCLVVNEDCTWTVYVHGHKLEDTTATPLSRIPAKLDCGSLGKLVAVLDSCTVCPGIPDTRFLEMADARKGKFERATVEDGFSVMLNGETYPRTIRMNSCQLLVHGAKGSSCKAYQSQLRATYSRWVRKSPTVKKFGNNRYLNTPKKETKLRNLQSRASSAEKEVRKLKEIILQRRMVCL